MAKREEGGWVGWWSRIALKGILSAIFTAAKIWKLWDGDNPTVGVRVGKKRLVREKRLLKIEQLRLVLASLGARVRFMVSIMYLMGLRISEVLGLRWSDIDWDERTINIRRRWYRGDLGEEEDLKSDAAVKTFAVCPAFLREFKTRYPGPIVAVSLSLSAMMGACRPTNATFYARNSV